MAKEETKKTQSDLEDVEEAISRAEEQLGAARKIAIDIVEKELGMDWTPHEEPVPEVAKKRLVRIAERITYLRHDACNLADNLGFLRKALKNNSPEPVAVEKK